MDLDARTLAYARRAVQKAAREFLYYPNIHMVDFGYKEEGGELNTDRLAIRFYVTEKLDDGPQLQSAVETGRTRRVPKGTFEGFETDVRKGVFRPHLWFRPAPPVNPRAVRSDPLCCGISISDERHNAYGTLGALVADRQTGEEMLLSNWHVLAADWIARPGQRIYQAGRLDGGGFRDTIAQLTRHGMDNGLDAAVAALNGSRQLVNEQFDLGPVKGVGLPRLGMKVVKSGRRTGVTYGVVTSAIETTVTMRYGSLNRMIQHVVTIEPRRKFDQISGPGDSGSCWLDEDTMLAVGLHFAGDDDPAYALAINMPIVLDALGVDLVV